MIKLIGIVIISAIIIVYLRSINGELAILATVASGIIVLYFVVPYVTQSFDVINQLIDMTGIDKQMYVIIFKITAIGYLVEFAASTVSDFGLKNLADKLIFAGKIIILTMSLPIIYSVINLLTNLLV